MQLVVPIAVKNAVSAATITFTASSITRSLGDMSHLSRFHRTVSYVPLYE